MNNIMQLGFEVNMVGEVTQADRSEGPADKQVAGRQGYRWPALRRSGDVATFLAG